MVLFWYIVGVRYCYYASVELLVVFWNGTMDKIAASGPALSLSISSMWLGKPAIACLSEYPAIDWLPG